MILLRERKEACHRLYRRGALQTFGPGDLVARGFADVGFEEFFVLHDGLLLSLTSGRRTELPSTERHAFFLLPSTDDIIAEIDRFGASVAWVRRDTDGLRWLVRVDMRDGAAQEVDAVSLHDGLLGALGRVLGIDPFQAEASRLRVDA